MKGERLVERIARVGNVVQHKRHFFIREVGGMRIGTRIRKEDEMEIERMYKG
jgi:hypothetical protein